MSNHLKFLGLTCTTRYVGGQKVNPFCHLHYHIITLLYNMFLKLHHKSGTTYTQAFNDLSASLSSSLCHGAVEGKEIILLRPLEGCYSKTW